MDPLSSSSRLAWATWGDPASIFFKNYIYIHTHVYMHTYIHIYNASALAIQMIWRVSFFIAKNLSRWLSETCDA